MTPDISIVTPVYNEGPNVEEFYTYSAGQAPVDGIQQHRQVLEIRPPVRGRICPQQRLGWNEFHHQGSPVR